MGCDGSAITEKGNGMDVSTGEPYTRHDTWKVLGTSEIAADPLGAWWKLAQILTLQAHAGCRWR